MLRLAMSLSTVLNFLSGAFNADEKGPQFRVRAALNFLLDGGMTVGFDVVADLFAPHADGRDKEFRNVDVLASNKYRLAPQVSRRTQKQGSFRKEVLFVTTWPRLPQMFRVALWGFPHRGRPKVDHDVFCK